MNETQLATILRRLRELTVGVAGDFFLDKYLDIDGRLTEPSLETGLDAYQITQVRTSPGAGGTVTNNLAALGVGRILALTVLGVDGEGFELKRELTGRGVDLTHVLETDQRRTPTYTKPMLDDGSGRARELNRLDIKNRVPMPALLVREVARRLDELVATADAVIVADQTSEPECGVIMLAVRERLAELGQRYPAKVILADSRGRIGLFRNVMVKPNRSECLRAARDDANRAAGVGERPLARAEPDDDDVAVESAARQLAARTRRPVYCTLGERGLLYVDKRSVVHVPAYAVAGPIDIVGAGDSATAGIVAALAAGAGAVDAAIVGNLVASITIQQIGTTGTASPEQVLARWRDVAGAH